MEYVTILCHDPTTEGKPRLWETRGLHPPGKPERPGEPGPLLLIATRTNTPWWRGTVTRQVDFACAKAYLVTAPLGPPQTQTRDPPTCNAPKIERRKRHRQGAMDV